VTADLAVLAARFAAALRAEGLAVGPDRAARFARAVMLVRPDRTEELYRCALATLVARPDDIGVLDRVFADVFGGHPAPAPAASPRTPTGGAKAPDVALGAADAPKATSGAPSAPNATSGARGGSGRGPARERQIEVPTLGSAAERLAARDFADLEPDELALLAGLMSRFRLATPLRTSRRYRPSRGGARVDLRATLRRARRSGAEPLVLSRHLARRKPRRLVVLCDISGSMQAHSRAMLQLLYSAAGGARAEVFTFATRLTRLTRALAAHPDEALRRAGETAPDWSGGTTIGAALREFLDTYGVRGMARGAVVVVISDGWETGDPRELGRQMARLNRIAHRVVWANPRTASPRYRPLVGGMAAAWPYCDAVVSAHRLDAVDALTTAIGEPHRHGVPHRRSDHPG
jgi:uncharacterized protein with von Willebrand factor type A (vWA) domain